MSTLTEPGPVRAQVGPAVSRRRPWRVVTLGPVTVRLYPRATVACVVLFLLVLAIGIPALSLGDYDVPPADVVRSVFGGGTGLDGFIVRSLRLPRWIAGVLVGAALGVGGALFQSLSRNPLGSPDIVGFNSGAATGALVVILIEHRSGSVTSVGAIVGGLATAVLVYLLTGRRGPGYKLVLIGIGLAAMLTAANNYLLTRADLNDAQQAAVWLIGSLNGRTWTQVIPVAVALAVFAVPAITVGRALRLLELGDDTAVALGIDGPRTRLLAIVVGVGLTAVGVSAAGPIGFVALSAPQIAHRLVGRPGPNVVAAALTGAVLLSASDLIAQHVFSGSLPVGVVTGVVGGAYLATLLVREWRRGRG